MSSVPPNVRVKLCALRTSKFNGRFGTRTKYHSDTGRFSVILDKMKTERTELGIKVKAENMEILGVPIGPTSLSIEPCILCHVDISIVGWEQNRRMCCGALTCASCLSRNRSNHFTNKCENCNKAIVVAPPQNLARLLRRAKKGETFAYPILGRCYELGDGCSVDLDKADLWYKKSVALDNNAMSMTGLANIERMQAAIREGLRTGDLTRLPVQKLRERMQSSWIQVSLFSLAAAQAEPLAMRFLQMTFHEGMPIPCTHCGSPSANPHTAKNGSELIQRKMSPCPDCLTGAYYCCASPCRDLDRKHHSIFCGMCKKGGSPQQMLLNKQFSPSPIQNGGFGMGGSGMDDGMGGITMMMGGVAGLKQPIPKLLIPEIIIEIPYDDETTNYDPCVICQEQMPRMPHHRIRLSCCGGFVCRVCSPAMNEHNIHSCPLCRNPWKDNWNVECVIDNANKGHAWAQTMLGSMFERGDGVKKNEVTARKWHKKSAKQGWYVGQNCYGLMLKNGCGGLQDVQEAMKWFERSGTKKNENENDVSMPEAAANAGAIYMSGYGNVTKDTKKALFWLEKAARAGVASSMYMLGYMLFDNGFGSGNPLASTDSAAFWIGQAAARGLTGQTKIFEKSVSLLLMFSTKMGIAIPCTYCGTVTKVTRKCSGCKGAVWFCGKICQKSAWTNGGHKKICNDIQKGLKVGTINIKV